MHSNFLTPLCRRTWTRSCSTAGKGNESLLAAAPCHSSSQQCQPTHGKEAAPAEPRVTFECLPADVAEVGPPLLVPAGHVPQQRPLLRETLLTKLAAERPLPGVRPVVLVQTRWLRGGDRESGWSEAQPIYPHPRGCQAAQKGRSSTNSLL